MAVAVPAAESTWPVPGAFLAELHPASPTSTPVRIATIERKKDRLIMDGHHAAVHLVGTEELEITGLLWRELDHLLVVGGF